jgi:hypothetical protein
MSGLYGNGNGAGSDSTTKTEPVPEPRPAAVPQSGPNEATKDDTDKKDKHCCGGARDGKFWETLCVGNACM